MEILEWSDGLHRKTLSQESHQVTWESAGLGDVYILRHVRPLFQEGIVKIMDNIYTRHNARMICTRPRRDTHSCVLAYRVCSPSIVFLLRSCLTSLVRSDLVWKYLSMANCGTFSRCSKSMIRYDLGQQIEPPVPGHLYLIVKGVYAWIHIAAC